MKKYIPTYINDGIISQQKVNRAEALVKTMLDNPITLDREGFGEMESEVILCAIDELKMLLGDEVNGVEGLMTSIHPLTGAYAFFPVIEEGE